MARINSNYLKLQAGYLFPEIARRVRAAAEARPDREILRLGIGDVTSPLPQAVVEAMAAAVREMGETKTFRGYGPEQGYAFLRECIAQNDYAARGVAIAPEEVFVSDGAKCDCGNIQEIFDVGARVAVADPVYPVYVDTNVMAGRTGQLSDGGTYDGLVYMPCTESNGFLPELPGEPVDLVYLCFPNNPTGAVATRDYLVRWVAHARETGAIILFDAAYEAFIRDEEIPHSIFEVEGAREVAIEFRSFSKTAGFTGTRCAFTVVPKELHGTDAEGRPVSIHRLWSRRQATKFNGVSYPVQRAAAAVYTPAGGAQVRRLTDGYMENARLLREGLQAAGLTVHGGRNAPYIWVKVPGGGSSWDFFDRLVEQAGVVGTPGAGFGPAGEGFLRFSAFGQRAVMEEAVERVSKQLQA